MKSKRLIGLALLFLCLCSFTSCNSDKPDFSQAQIKEMLQKMKGTYHGSVEVAYFQGSSISKINDVVVTSSDKLSFKMSLLPIAENISDEDLAKTLRDIKEVDVTAEYDFIQMDDNHSNFSLYPKEVIIPGGYGSPPTIKIVFSDIFGGDANISSNSMIFNISPKEIWVNDKMYKDFKQHVYHFEGISKD